MIIANSSVAMSSTRSFSQSGLYGKGVSGAYSLKENEVSGFSSMYNMDAYEEGNKDFLDYLGNYEDLLNSPVSTGNVSNAGLSEIPKENSIENSILEKLFQRMKDGDVFGRLQGNSLGRKPGQVVTFQEQESTNFSAQGLAQTADGRTIDFSIELSMSRSYMEYTNLRVNALNNALVDPLVINVGGGITNISDKKFFFDLDCDGKKESISSLGKGSGFLALDLNGDGVINDGRELFGTESGNGFADLAKYDGDGNGWIDEADEVFSRLKVWCKGEKGEDILMDLKEAGVGAIFLGNVDTQFSEYGMSGLNGVVRSTGFFLMENGGVGTVAHVDLATGTQETQMAGMATKVPVENGSGYVFETGIFSEVNIDLSTSKEAISKAKSNMEIRKEAELKREKRLEERKMFRDYLLKKRQERKEMMDKHLEKVIEKRKEHAELFEAEIAGE